MNIMRKFLVLTIGLLSTTLIYGVQGELICGGMVCPLNSACTVRSRNVDGFHVTSRSCYTLTGDVFKEEITQEEEDSEEDDSEEEEDSEGEDSDYDTGGSKMCIITRDMVNGKMNSTEMCQDENGEFRPMTPEEERDFKRRIGEVEETARRAEERARQTAKRLHEEGMRRANEGLARAQRLSAEENLKRMTANMRHIADKEALARRLEEAAARRERARRQMKQ